MQLLNKAALGWLATSAPNGPPKAVDVPSYDPQELKPGILHVGVGNFFRAHLANYLDELFSEDSSSNNWGIVGAAVTNGSYSKRKEALEKQDLLYSLVERDGDGSKAKVVGSIIDLLPYEEEFGPIKERLLDPDIKIVSTCITEGGYFLNPSTGELDVENDKIQHDIQNPDDPKTVMGVLVQALRKRKEKGLDPFTVLCCDNIPHNGDATKRAVCGVAENQDEELGTWVKSSVFFPNSMVDRITPKTGKKEVDYLQETYGFKDEDPVFCEPFIQWVVEDTFVNNERPAFDKVGVQFVADVTPYELAKLRILNGGHASLCYPAGLLGIEYVHEAMEHPVIGPFLDCLERSEIVPCVDELPDISTEEYWESIQKRFENPTINDRIDRNCEDGSDRQPKFIIPTINLAIEKNQPLDGLALVSAMWCRFCQGTDEKGNEIPPSDSKWDKLTETAEKAKSDPSVWLAMKETYGDVGKNKRFSDAFAAAVKKIDEDGVEAAMKEYISKNDASSKTQDSNSVLTGA